ncbi:serine/threonine-protein kinase PknK [Aphanothece hegewaldii CCALA 016]|uniref:histidine kinase n=1 Tax=Aphanothece hegewaldii CCALA 016 TaxID=2107694 RepID=A0A2T1LVE6_9CHRO|nr:ATP-binding sensor histidine kinase [Aphanothece hegewaldii]PSF35692.1 serine/threonine-protein kinase PknK [Aphanothece hegewaldii CCALA 016]
MEIGNVKIVTQIHESSNSIIYRGIWQENQQSVILKVLRLDYPTPAQLHRYQQEYSFTHSLNIDGVIKSYAIQSYQRTQVIIFEDFGATSLKQLFQEQSLSVEEWLWFGIKLSDILGRIHSENIIHKDINPANIVFNPETKQLKIIDFGISTQLNREYPTLQNPNLLEGTLAYMSPEQTGRMNRSLDYRTDFYSLGITFYELLTGQLPFNNSEPLDLVHCHLAKSPISPHEIKSDIPEIISQIILKMMAKNSEERYQSAWGIKADLEKCYQQLQSKKIISNFVLGQQDISETFQIPQKLYGRELEIQSLLTHFEQVSQGQRKIMLVAGYSGIGKSALVQEIYKPITRQKGYFISGKFADVGTRSAQLQLNIPYASLIQAFSELIRQILTETEAQVNQWKQKLLDVLGINGQIIVEVIPEVELILGKQPNVPNLPPTEAQNRFNLVLQNFLAVFAKKEHPLVIFLDDLQWADQATLKLIKSLMTQSTIQSLFLIGTYRNNEVKKGHPLKLLQEELQKEGINIPHLLLQPLKIDVIKAILVDTFNINLTKTQEIAELILQKTQGNPFFINEFLKFLYTDKLINFNSQLGRWVWNIEQIKTVPIANNVVELIADKIQKLSESTQKVIRIASCIGHRFDFNTLLIVAQKTPQEINQALLDTIQEGLIIPIGNEYKYLTIESQNDYTKVFYRFIHDRVQQAAYSLLSLKQKQDIHLEIGQLLLHYFSPEEQEERIFEIVNQLNFSLPLITSQKKRNELAELNLIAGKKAKISAAYDASFKYLKQGLELLSTERWQKQYSLTLELYLEAAETAYLCVNFAETERLVLIIIKNANNLLDKVKAYEIELASYIYHHKYIEAIEIGLSVLKLLGVNIPKHPNQIALLFTLLKIRFSLLGKKIDDLVNLPSMTNLKAQAIIRIIIVIAPSIYMANPSLLFIAIVLGIQLSLKYGNSKESAYLYSIYGLICCGKLNDIETGYKFGNLALELLKKRNIKFLESKIVLSIEMGIKFWKEDLKNTLSSLKENYQLAMQIGDLEYSGYSASVFSNHVLFSLSNLSLAEQEMNLFSQSLQNLKQERNVNFVNLTRQVALNFIGQAENPCLIVGQAYNEYELLPLELEISDRNKLLQIYTHKLILNYFFGNYQTALENSDIAVQYIDGGVGTLTIPTYYLYDALCRLAIYPTSNLAQKQSIQQKIKKIQQQFNYWSQHAPMNFANKFYLIEAEKNRIFNQPQKAIDCYEKSLDLAQKHDYLAEEALGYELAAKFYISQHKERLARNYMQEARYCYTKWGALAKVKHLEKNYPQLLTLEAENQISATLTSQETHQLLDLATVMQAHQAIAEELVLDKLLMNLMQILITNVGAQKGYLILDNQGNLSIEAQGNAEQEQYTVLQSLPLIGYIPISVINYVMRTRNSLILDNASEDGNFSSDLYIQTHQLKSILCTPLITQGQLKGIIYLENNLICGAFTLPRLKLIQLLSGQAAIAIENAQLYNQLEQKVIERTQELTKTLETLKTTQQELIQSEKLAALGQLIAGIAHEINTPLGVINSSIGNIRYFFSQNLKPFLDFWETLTPQNQSDLLALIEKVSQPTNPLSTREQRQLKKTLITELEQQQIKNAPNLAKILINIGIHEQLNPWLPLLHTTEGEKLLKTAAEFANIQTSINNIATATERASKVVFALKTYARYDQGGEKVQSDIIQSIETVLILYQNLLKQGIEVITQYPEKTPLIWCYPDEINQVWTNLIYNALQAMEFKGILSIKVQTQTQTHQLFVSITDSGKGIPTETLPYIFDPFFTTKPAGEGSGLGLHIVRQIIEKHQGNIEVTSLVGQTTFTVALPIG